MNDWQASRLVKLTEALESFTAAVVAGDDREEARRRLIALFELVRESEAETGLPHPLRADLVAWQREICPEIEP